MPANKPRWKRLLIWLLGIYLALPFLAGAFGSEIPRGPKIYQEDMHALFYAVGRGIFQGKSPPKSDFYGRAWFYFMKREKLKQRFVAPDWPQYDSRF